MQGSEAAKGVQVREGDLLFSPGTARVARARLTAFIEWLEGTWAAGPGSSASGAPTSYEELWRWSVEDPGGFWSSFATFARLPFAKPPSVVLEGPGSPEGARWFPGAELNYVDCVLRHEPTALGVIAIDESGRRSEHTYGEVTALAARAARGLRRLGVARGDRVAAVMANGLEAVATFLASASLGAIWSACAPEFGASSMLDRFRQIEPKVLVTASTYRYGGKEFDLGAKTKALADGLGHTVLTSFDDLISTRPGAAGEDSELLTPVPVPFDHPLWILYSSGTTGLPKAIVQGHGGIVLEHLKMLELQSDVVEGERFFWFSTTGWMMWNLLVGGLLTGATIVLYDGSPFFPDEMALWQMAEREQVTYFGTSAPYLEACRKAGLIPRASLDLTSVRSIGSTGAPLSPEGFAWASEAIGNDVMVSSVSGGTDVCTAFLAGCPLLPVYAGELQCAALGAAVEAYSPEGRPLLGEVGELVVTTPMPSMPVALWGDLDGSRLHEAYFAEFEGLWRHGDWVKRTERGTYVVYGRSDATLNRGGVRMGTAEFYSVVEAVDGITDSLVVDTSELGRDGELILFVVLATDFALESVEPVLRAELRAQVSPRHVPDRVVALEALPRTLNGKKVEVPVRRILLGTAVTDAVSRDSLAEPAALDRLLEALQAAGLL